jgi:hypothetical protein
MSAIVTPPSVDGIELRIARDIARKALIAAPVMAVGLGLWRGWGAVLGVALAVGVVLGCLFLVAALASWAARISLSALAGAVLGGFLLQLGLVLGALFAVQALPVVDFPVFAYTLIVAQLGLLFWELRSISLSLASPGLRPRKESRR